MSVITFIAYAIDKRRAIQQGWRIPEKTLQTLAFLGGWPGALLGQTLLRHKTRKTPFLVLFWCLVVLHLAIVVGVVVLLRESWM